MKFLVTSDIHDNLLAVQKMRTQEGNVFDAIVVAGDIGSNRTQEIFDVLASFECPVLYVYGNWDHKLEYETAFSKTCHHLHLAPYEVGPITFAGFSGCTASWGKNPIAAAIEREIQQAHADVLHVLDDEKRLEKVGKIRLEAGYAAALHELTASSPRKPSQKKLKSLEAEHRRLLSVNSEIVADVENSRAYGRYLSDRNEAGRKALVRNRQELSAVVTGAGINKERLVVVTHDRLYKTHVDFSGVPVFLFGHRHGFAQTQFQGSQHINVSALDTRTLLKPKTFARGDQFEQFRNLNTGNYAILEWTRDIGFRARPIALEVGPGWQENWEPETYIKMPGAAFLA